MIVPCAAAAKDGHCPLRKRVLPVIILVFAAVVELADTRDLKSRSGNRVPVRPRSAAPHMIRIRFPSGNGFGSFVFCTEYENAGSPDDSPIRPESEQGGAGLVFSS